MEEIIYPIEEETEEGRLIVIKAGIKFVEKGSIKYEGVKIKIPSETRNMDKLVFAVLSVKRNDEYDYFDIGLHAHFGLNMGGLKEPYDIGPMSDCYIDGGGDIETKLTVSKELLKKWTGITGKDIDHGIDSIRMGSTYNLMISLPRKITVTKDKVIISKNNPEIIDSMNVCNLIFKNQHPIDKNV